MQIPYDLEFTQNRPTVKLRAVVLPQPYGMLRGAHREKDVFDALLAWVHEKLRRLEKKQ